jgi:hypothetical protein
MDRETEERLQQQRAAFIAKFGRQPGARDPVFFDPNSNVPKPLPDDAIDDVLPVLTEAAAEIGVDPALIYAMRKTGRIVTMENEHLIPKPELDAWNAACAEGHRLLAKKH